MSLAGESGESGEPGGADFCSRITLLMEAAKYSRSVVFASFLHIFKTAVITGYTGSELLLLLV